MKTFALIGLAVLANPAVAQVTAPVPATQTAAVASGKAASGKTGIVCRTLDVTGSRLQKRKECHTPAEWEDIRMRERQAVELRQSNRASGQ